MKQQDGNKRRNKKYQPDAQDVVQISQSMKKPSGRIPGASNSSQEYLSNVQTDEHAYTSAM